MCSVLLGLALIIPISAEATVQKGLFERLIAKNKLERKTRTAAEKASDKSTSPSQKDAKGDTTVSTSMNAGAAVRNGEASAAAGIKTEISKPNSHTTLSTGASVDAAGNVTGLIGASKTTKTKKGNLLSNAIGIKFDNNGKLSVNAKSGILSKNNNLIKLDIGFNQDGSIRANVKGGVKLGNTNLTVSGGVKRNADGSFSTKTSVGSKTSFKIGDSTIKIGGDASLQDGKFGGASMSLGGDTTLGKTDLGSNTRIGIDSRGNTYSDTRIKTSMTLGDAKNGDSLGSNIRLSSKNGQLKSASLKGNLDIGKNELNTGLSGRRNSDGSVTHTASLGGKTNLAGQKLSAGTGMSLRTKDGQKIASSSYMTAGLSKDGDNGYSLGGTTLKKKDSEGNVYRTSMASTRMTIGKSQIGANGRVSSLNGTTTGVYTGVSGSTKLAGLDLSLGVGRSRNSEGKVVHNLSSGLSGDNFNIRNRTRISDTGVQTTTSGKMTLGKTKLGAANTTAVDESGNVSTYSRTSASRGTGFSAVGSMATKNKEITSASLGSNVEFKVTDKTKAGLGSAVNWKDGKVSSYSTTAGTKTTLSSGTKIGTRAGLQTRIDSETGKATYNVSSGAELRTKKNLNVDSATRVRVKEGEGITAAQMSLTARKKMKDGTVVGAGEKVSAYKTSDGTYTVRNQNEAYARKDQAWTTGVKTGQVFKAGELVDSTASVQGGVRLSNKTEVGSGVDVRSYKGSDGSFTHKVTGQAALDTGNFATTTTAGVALKKGEVVGTTLGTSAAVKGESGAYVGGGVLVESEKDETGKMARTLKAETKAGIGDTFVRADRKQHRDGTGTLTASETSFGGYVDTGSDTGLGASKTIRQRGNVVESETIGTMHGVKGDIKVGVNKDNQGHKEIAAVANNKGDTMDTMIGVGATYEDGELQETNLVVGGAGENHVSEFSEKRDAEGNIISEEAKSTHYIGDNVEIKTVTKTDEEGTEKHVVQKTEGDFGTMKEEVHTDKDGNVSTKLKVDAAVDSDFDLKGQLEVETK
ncbi:MAG: hypothetical protein EOM53_05045 [Alphaproteobacteria bacterium]|nr:hypothetical protein [Alphaproteobacteria bacterium]